MSAMAARPWVDARQWDERTGGKRVERDRHLVRALECERMLHARAAAEGFLGSLVIPSAGAREKVLDRLTRQQAAAWAEQS